MPVALQPQQVDSFLQIFKATVNFIPNFNQISFGLQYFFSMN